MALCLAGRQSYAAVLLLAVWMLRVAPLRAEEPPIPAPPEPPPEWTVRLGLISYEDAPGQVQRYRAVFQDLAKRRGAAIHLEIAQGTYAEVLHWINRGQVDLAVLSPGAYAEALAETADHPDLKPCEYLVSEGLPPSLLPWASPERQADAWSFEYRALCLVRKDSALKSFDDLKAAVNTGKGRVIFVDPLSIAGRIVPQAACRKSGLAIGADAVEYAYAHSHALNLLAQSDPKEACAAFVYDGASYSSLSKPQDSFREIEVPGLRSYAIPSDLWVARAGYDHANEIKAALLQRNDAQGREPFRDESTGLAARVKDLRAWMKEAEADLNAPMTVNEIAGLLRHYERTHATPPRLALVLSGGGAKCSYQVGAVAALEERLAALRKDHPDEPWLDFRLVVGTSGGAINALPIAMGLAATEPGREAFANVWQSLDLKKMVAPSNSVCAAIGLWLAGVYATLGFVLLRLGRRVSGKVPGRAWALPLALAVLALAVFVLAMPWAPTEWFGHNRALRYLSLYWGFGISWAFLFLPLFGLGAWFVHTRPEERRVRAGFLAWSLTAVLLVLIPVVTGALALFSERTLFYGSGIERVLAGGFEQLTAVADPTFQPQHEATPHQRLRAVSSTIVAKKLVKRDLVITGNCLPPSLPSDRYFFLPGAASQGAPPFGRHGVALAGYPPLLLDVVMGSGTIYPIFPSRELEDFPAAGQKAELIDGGFAHNSPIEAAVLWGATHVILIEASPAPEQKGSGADFLESAGDAFNYLYDQAQLADVRSKERVAIFTLRPKPPHLFMLDFAPAFIRDAVAKGRADAGQASFQRQPGEPHFRGE